jgi:hypothetical protein
MPRTPISGLSYVCEPATGHDEIALLEAGSPLDAAVTLTARRARTPAGEPIAPYGLPVGDLDSIVTEFRRMLFGDRMIAEGNCGTCGAPIDIAFRLDAFTAHHRPRRPRNVAPDGEREWVLTGDGTRFRLPTVGDVQEAVREVDPAAALAGRCIEGEVTASRRRRAERAMAQLAPTLAAEVVGRCPECDEATPLWTDLRELCLADLRFVAGTVLEEVHLLAESYHWHEDAILSMPSDRRASYADCIRASRGAPLGAEAFRG